MLPDNFCLCNQSTIVNLLYVCSYEELNSIVNSSLLLIAGWLNILALPYTVYSICYQAKIVRQWCPLCLIVQLILVLQFITALFGEFYSHASFSLLSIISIGVSLFILSGGIGGFGNVFPTGYKRYWVDWIWCTQFIVIYRPFFKRILDEPFYDSDTADGKLSEMASNKMVIYPFISIQNDFGYSDVTRANNEVSGKITEHFREADECLRKVDQIVKYCNKFILEG